ncbi:FHA domain-containing protein [Conexibacter sp. SYSU D00693]|uniref:FHA domain-containing protein n=1 Tax=Conexibacter sp. SYSU D00693 TaxID=2812560 RepID=UPI00196A59C9|nr:FHA domain-containing protein [Conexibacter sp. SYSU D00693]
MDARPQTLRQRTPAELKRLVELDRAGDPYLVHRDPSGRQLETVLLRDRLSIGRDPACDVALPWDAGVSRLHAELERVAASWVLVDDGLSRNGTWVGETRVAGRRRLDDQDVVRVGSTLLLFRAPALPGAVEATAVEAPAAPAPELSPAQRRVLVALCRPFAGGGAHALPATNRAIAAELVLSEEAVKTHLRTLFQKFDVGDLPQNAKRARVVELALRSGAVTPGDLGR